MKRIFKKLSKTIKKSRIDKVVNRVFNKKKKRSNEE